LGRALGLLPPLPSSSPAPSSQAYRGLTPGTDNWVKAELRRQNVLPGATALAESESDARNPIFAALSRLVAKRPAPIATEPVAETAEPQPVEPTPLPNPHDEGSPEHDAFAAELARVRGQYVVPADAAAPDAGEAGDALIAEPPTEHAAPTASSAPAEPGAA